MKFIVIWLVFFTAQVASADTKPSPLEVHIAKRTIDSKLSEFEIYWMGLLRLALEKSGEPYVIKFHDGEHMTHARMIRNIQSGTGVNIAYMGASLESEKALRPIRIPVFKGLIGYRIFLIKASQQQAFDTARNIDDLKRFTIGLGMQWPDEPLMKEAGFKLFIAPYATLFGALAAGRYDGMSRAAHEIQSELDLIKTRFPSLAIEEKVVLAYRQASFFFVAKDNHRLANAIEAGLLRAYDDGSFDAYFNNSNVVKRAIKLLSAPNRKTYWIENHHLSEDTRAIPEKFWYSSNGNAH